MLTDMLPFEVPPTFSNRGLYTFLIESAVSFEGNKFRWKNGGRAVNRTMCLLFGLRKVKSFRRAYVTQWGKMTRYLVVTEKESCKNMTTVPFEFRISHKDDGRTLSIAHPRNQFWMANFYFLFSASITYYTSLSEFSIRHPVSVARVSYFNDLLHKLKLKKLTGVEEHGREYEQYGSYFVYEKYSNIYSFFESYQYQRCEKEFAAMIQLDISKCFDSIYTHSISWALFGKSQTKQSIPASNFSFGGVFDKIIRRLNNNETKGIVIGPEFSRIFAEIILQSIDVAIEVNLKKRRSDLNHKADYRVFRYVDDYFIFLKDLSSKDLFIEAVQEALKDVKLSINMSKIHHYERPIITELTIAKQRVSTLLSNEIKLDIAKKEDSHLTMYEPSKVFVSEIYSNRLIVLFKKIVKESDVQYRSIVNYTVSIAERKVDRVITLYNKLHEDKVANQERVIKAMRSIFEFMFFVYSASPSVSLSVIVCRIIAKSVNFLNGNEFGYDAKHLLFKSIHDNIRLVLDKNTMGAFREVESLYLLIALSTIGTRYRLSQELIAKHFLIKFDKINQSYSRDSYLSYFSITTLLFYMKKKVRYIGLRRFIEDHAVDKIRSLKFQCHDDAEAMMLFLDILVCPYVRLKVKIEMAEIFGLNERQCIEIQSANDYWFTAWSEKFDLAKALDLKRRREVY